MREIERYIDALAGIGHLPEGGVYRGSYTAAESEAQALVGEWMREAGLRVRRDAIGNLWGRLDGTSPGASAIVAGSHLDSVRNGGNYDGPLGVVGGLLAVRELLRQHGPPQLPLEVVAFTGEEGSRFPLGLMGSKAVAGALDRALLDTVCDSERTTVAEGMRRVGLDPARLGDARRSDVGAYLEIHIEQGPLLESAGVPIGIVRAIVGHQWIKVAVRGKPDHAGTTPMHLRKDALLGAARMIDRLPDVASRSGTGVITVGRITALPGSTNVVPGRVEFTIDVRHPAQAALQEMIERAEQACNAVAAAAGLELTWELPTHGTPPVETSPRIQEICRESCREQGLAYLDMTSGAGHDAQAMAHICPVGVIFIPCREGRSHTPDEYASTADMEEGIAVLSGCLRKLAYERALADK